MGLYWKVNVLPPIVLLRHRFSSYTSNGNTWLLQVSLTPMAISLHCIGATSATRTQDTRLKRAVLSPTELMRHNLISFVQLEISKQCHWSRWLDSNPHISRLLLVVHPIWKIYVIQFKISNPIF